MLSSMDATLPSVQHYMIDNERFQMKGEFSKKYSSNSEDDGLSPKTRVLYFENSSELLQVLETDEDEVAEILLQLKGVKVVVPGESSSESDHEQSTSTSTSLFPYTTSILGWKSMCEVEPEAEQYSSECSSSESGQCKKRKESQIQSMIPSLVKRSKSLDGLSAISSNNGGNEDGEMESDRMHAHGHSYSYSHGRSHSDEDFFQDDDEEWMDINLNIKSPSSNKASVELNQSLPPYSQRKKSGKRIRMRET